jgi:hypothetical protein
VREQPIGGHNGKTVQDLAHGFPYTHETVNGSDFRQHMGRVGALAFPRLQPSLLLT